MSKVLRSWGGVPRHSQQGHACDWSANLKTLLAEAKHGERTTLPFGNGRSYGDSCLAESGHVIHMRPLDHFLSVDWQKGIVKAEAGITLGEIIDLTIPQGWFLPVTPGTRYVTLGGAIANDVHGKNHHCQGTFGKHLIRMALYRNGQTLICSQDENPELYRATISGLGLTGIIIWAEIALRPIRTSQIDTHHQRFGSLSEFFSLSKELDPVNEYSVAWIDCTARGHNLGRGIFSAGNHSEYGALENPPLRKISVAATPPISLVNSLSVRAFNSLYWHRLPPNRSKQRESYSTFFYPLDNLLHWNRLYGALGFQQHQCVIPETHAESAIREMLKIIATAKQGSFLAVLKRCGDAVSPGLLSFPMQGISLALDFAQNNSLEALFKRLDAIVYEAGGRLYPAKDAHMSAVHFRHAYPAWEKLEKLRDPLMMSAFWKRVTA
ncbi:FAD-binding oxidoreductase [Pseudomonas fulva]|uniref:FAD-binding oxidoreductase n=1 Tax=Pseudomonas fulva TaxID=47880 RepID=UPI00201DFC42|nr:FAD-binding oxidoreductase [Pseudomonas fulva]UQY36097.1 FAD-binding oxidoreductase [Pseudomonas fulva]